jgi:NAD(P)-dependent dehydrogenase (short-subunit alcohol dehydrogenase family)
MGLETALVLAKEGDRVFGTVLNEAERQQVLAEAARRGVTVEPLIVDVTQPATVAAGVAQVIAQTGRIDLLVQFAGIGLRGFFEDLSLEEIRRVYEVNVFGSMVVTQAVLPHMRLARRGRILLTTSIGGRIGAMTISGYSSSKFAVEGFGECLRQELRPFGIWVSLLEPGLIKTPHFTAHRNRAARAKDPASPYYPWFCQHEHLVDQILDRGSFSAHDVANQVSRILNARAPKLRYVVGRNAKIVFALRRYIPGEWFESVYWAITRRMVTRPSKQILELSGK